MDKVYNLVELFSGIGSQAKALENIGFRINTVGTCEWDVHAFTAYDAIHNDFRASSDIDSMSKEELLAVLSGYTLSNDGKTPMEYKVLRTYSVESLRKIWGAIVRSNNFVDINNLTGEVLPDNIDILTYSFPCQDLSNVGAFHGYNKGIDRDSGSRSSLLWQVGRILEEMKDSGKNLPKYLLMENVPALLAERHYNNFRKWIQELSDLGYVSLYYPLNALDFGLPQNRPRLLMISVHADSRTTTKRNIINYFAEKNSHDIVKDFRQSPFYRKIEMSELFRMDYDNRKYFREACECTPNATVSRQTIWDNNPQLVLKGYKVNPEYDHVRTITCKQDRHPNSGNLYFNSRVKGRCKWRYLTPRECFLFMGFSEEDFENVISDNPEIRKNSVLFPRDKLIRMAGNSIPVKLLEGIFWQIKLFEDYLEENGCS